MSARIPCPDVNEVRQFLDDKLPPDRWEFVTNHLDRCSKCAAILVQFRDDSRTIDRGGPPSESRW